MAKLLELSMKELDRVKVLNRVMLGELTQVLAAKMLGITDRQVRNLLYRFKEEGDNGCISKKRGKPSNRRLTNKREILSIVSANYPDFSPKLAAEYLYKNHGIKVSKETLRRWMIEIHIWIPREKGKKKMWYVGEVSAFRNLRQYFYRPRRYFHVLVIVSYAFGSF